MLDLVNLPPLIARTRGQPGVVVGLLDGPIDSTHPDLADARLRPVPGGPRGTCRRVDSAACGHGTLVAGILCARRGSAVPAICPDCTILLRPIFDEGAGTADLSSAISAKPAELTAAIVECIDSGAHVLNLSVGLALTSTRDERELHEALDLAMKRGTLVIAAAGNQGTLGSSAITRHPWVITVSASDRHGMPLASSNLGHSTSRRGVLAPGEGVISLAAGGGQLTAGGSSVAAAFVSGTAALLWSLFPGVGAAAIRRALTQGDVRRTTVVPPLLDAERAYRLLAATVATTIMR